MNERIKELALQAGLQPFEDCGPGYVYKMEKFAELIVQECIDVSWLSANDTKSKEWQSGYTKGQLDSRVLIKQHFGVEE